MSRATMTFRAVFAGTVAASLAAVVTGTAIGWLVGSMIPAAAGAAGALGGVAGALAAGPAVTGFVLGVHASRTIAVAYVFALVTTLGVGVVALTYVPIAPFAPLLMAASAALGIRGSEAASRLTARYRREAPRV